MRDFIIRHKKALAVSGGAIAAALVLVLIAVTVLWNTCNVTPIDLKFEAVKQGRRREALGTVQIHITGQYQDYLFKEDILELDIEDFDGFKNIRMREKDSCIFFRNQQGCAYFEAEAADRAYTDTLRLYFTENFDRVFLKGRIENCYIGSGSGRYTASECVSYFEEATELWDVVEYVDVDIILDGVFMDATGKEGEKAQLRISGYYRDYLFEADPLYLEMDPILGFSFISTPNNTKLDMRELPKRNLSMGFMGMSGYIPSENKTGSIILYFTDEYDRCIIRDASKTVFYVGSVSGKYTAREIVEYFNAFTTPGIILPNS